MFRQCNDSVNTIILFTNHLQDLVQNISNVKMKEFINILKSIALL